MCNYEIRLRTIKKGTIEKGTIEKGTIEKGTIEKGTIEKGTGKQAVTNGNKVFVEFTLCIDTRRVISGQSVEVAVEKVGGSKVRSRRGRVSALGMF